MAEELGFFFRQEEPSLLSSGRYGLTVRDKAAAL